VKEQEVVIDRRPQHFSGERSSAVLEALDRGDSN
jgi:hypothetical protein